MRLVLPFVAVVSSLWAVGCCSTCGKCNLFSCSNKNACAAKSTGTPTTPSQTAVTYKNPRSNTTIQPVGAVQPQTQGTAQPQSTGSVQRIGTNSLTTPASSPITSSGPISSLPPQTSLAPPAKLPDNPPSATISVPAPPAMTALSLPQANLPTPRQIAATE